MKRKLLIAALAFAAVGVSAQKNVSVENAQARAIDVTASSFVKPLTVELQIDQQKGRITDEWQFSLEDMQALGLDKFREDELNNLRSFAVFKSCQKHGCDVIVAPTFHIQSNNLAGGLKVTLVGFCANFTNWKTMTDADLQWIRMELVSPRLSGQAYEPAVTPGR